MKASRRFAGYVLVLSVVLVASPLGCSKKADQSTPEAAVQSFFEAIMDGDGDRAASCVHGSDEAKDFVRGMANVTGAMKDFEEAVKAEWGDEGWAYFSDGGGGMTMDTDLEKLEETKARIEGDKAYVTVPGDDNETVLVRKDGKWYIDTNNKADFPSGKEAKQGTKMMNQMAEMVREKQDRIGAEGVTAESLSQEFGMGMMAIMTGAMGD
ncbi:MAG: hypothetical protein ACLFVW_00925 [Phycisphaerae bacterium]